MARLAAVLKALGATTGRRLPGLHALVSNNFVIFVGLLSYEQASHGRFLLDLLALLLLLPLCGDPLRRVPSERLGLLPLSGRDRWALRLLALALALQPPFWVAVGAFVFGQRGLGFTALLALAGGMLLERIPRRGDRGWDLLPPLPGVLGALVRKELRGLGRVLDAYLAGAIALATLVFQITSPAPDPAMRGPLTFIVVLALSTHGQCLLAQDGPEGLRRFRLLPLRGWHILLAKDLAHLALLALLVAPLSPVQGLAAGMLSLAAGHHASVHDPEPMRPWRFCVAASLGCSALQVGGMLLALAMGPWALALALPMWAASLHWYGRAMEA